MLVWRSLGGLWLLLLAMWPPLGLCSNTTGLDYRCGKEGVQLQVSPEYLGEELSFQIRDEFDMGYDILGCLSKCLLSTQSPDGGSIFYTPYIICLAVQKDGAWLLRVRLVGRAKSEDLDLICPKPKTFQPRIMHHTPRPRSPKTSAPTTSHPWKTTQYRTESPTVKKLPSDRPTIKTSLTNEYKVTTKRTENLITMVMRTANDTVFRQTEKLPSVRPTDFMPTTESSDKLTPSQCLVPKGRITCLNSTVPRDTCLGYRCCHDPVDAISPCHYGHTVTVHCFPDGLFRLILSRYVTTPPLRLSSVVLGPGTCPSATILGDFLEFKGHLSTCSSSRFLQGRLVYQLSLTAKPHVRVSPLGSITRDSSLTVLSRCLYNTLTNVSLVVLAPKPPTVTSTGVLSVELRISKGSSYSSFYASEDFPLEVLLRELVFLEARLLQPSDRRLHLRLHHCWGAPSMNPASTLGWPVVYDGCPYSDDDTVTKILPGSIPSSYQRFAVSAFTFVGFPYNTEVYFFCSVSVCLPSLSESCTSDCANLTRSRRAESDTSLYFVGTTGPVVFQRSNELGLASFEHLTSTFPGIVFAVIFLILALLLACILTVKCSYQAENE